MKTTKHPSITEVPVHAANDDAQVIAEFDELVRHAAAGDRRAIGAIAIAFGPIASANGTSTSGRSIPSTLLEFSKIDIVPSFSLLKVARSTRLTQ